MSTEGIRKVRESEEIMEKRIHEASDRADQILAEGTLEVQRRLAAAEDRAKSEIDRLRRELADKADGEIRYIKEKAEDDRRTIEKVARIRIDGAVKAVLEAVWK